MLLRSIVFPEQILPFTIFNPFLNENFELIEGKWYPANSNCRINTVMPTEMEL